MTTCLIRTLNQIPKTNKRILYQIKNFSTKTDPTGGVWAQTSFKRDKISELKSELPKNCKTLDDAASPIEKLDLNFIDGLKLIAKVADESSWGIDKPLKEVDAWLDNSSTIVITEEEQGLNKEMLNEQEYQHHLDEGRGIIRKCINPGDCKSSFTSIVEFVEVEEIDDNKDIISDITANTNKTTEESFEQCLTFYRLCLLKSAMDVLSSNFSKLLEITSEDLDRAAVAHESPPSSTTIPLNKMNAVLQSFTNGTCIDQCQAIWNLHDKDNDTLLGQVEMDNVVFMLLEIHSKALEHIFPNIIDTFEIGNLSWRKRRQQINHYKTLKKIFAKTLQNHFDLEVETPHRLRCIYAWAEKSHQDNKMDSILVENDSITGKKRYVELSPKISYSEFRVEQERHFSHLDRIGQEFMGSFREDVLVLQGGKRQNKQLRREVFWFFGIVTVADLGILAL